MFKGHGPETDLEAGSSHRQIQKKSNQEAIVAGVKGKSGGKRGGAGRPPMSPEQHQQRGTFRPARHRRHAPVRTAKVPTAREAFLAGWLEGMDPDTKGSAWITLVHHRVPTREQLWAHIIGKQQFDWRLRSCEELLDAELEWPASVYHYPHNRHLRALLEQRRRQREGDA